MTYSPHPCRSLDCLAPLQSGTPDSLTGRTGPADRSIDDHLLRLLSWMSKKTIYLHWSKEVNGTTNDIVGQGRGDVNAHMGLYARACMGLLGQRECPRLTPHRPCPDPAGPVFVARGEAWRLQSPRYSSTASRSRRRASGNGSNGLVEIRRRSPQSYTKLSSFSCSPPRG